MTLVHYTKLAGGLAYWVLAGLKKGRLNMIRKVNGKYQVFSSKGRNMGGPYKTLEEAKKRLRQVEFFKHRKPR